VAEKNVVVSTFGDEAAADAAVVALDDADGPLQHAIGIQVDPEASAVGTA
jgi:hypothetical protein